MKILYIDTTNREEIKVALEIDKKHFEKKSKIKSDQVLSLIDKLLTEKKVKVHELDEVKVNKGPGSFTGIRVGLAIANALGFALNIPVNGKIGPDTEPRYTE